jgi:hypothetical protein
MKNLRLINTILVLACLFVGCKPDEMVIEIYTSDIKMAIEDEIIQVPITVTFSMFGDDDDGTLSQASVVAKRYLHEKSEFKVSEGDWGDVLLIKTKIPMGTTAKLKTYLSNNPSPFALVIENPSVSLNTTAYFDRLNQELYNINMMIDIEKTANSNIFRFIGDTKEAPEITAIAVFIDNQPELIFSQTVERRETLEINFKGEDASIYSQISPQFSIKF